MRRRFSCSFRRRCRSLGAMLLGLASLVLIGCDAPTSAPVAAPSSTLPPGAVPVGGAPTAPGAAAASGTAPSEGEQAAGTSVVAGVGVGRNGHAYGNDPLTLPAATYWRAKEKIAFEIAIPHALQLYKANDIDGRGPETHEIFMREIVEANRIEMPKLPDGLHYRYDPQTEQLMVESDTNSP
ncbi:MAG TPA: hypothetical protein DCQ98_01060 [Planctomycetaceae bacterium]|nr:hypothetical protein [Planctomycetaceae bacterium]HRE99545.1 hypothetical protein [Pirellulaceae bacterium]